MILVLSGERGAGKTTTCLEIDRMASVRGFQLGGVVSPARFVGNVKVGIDVLDLRSRQRRRLAETIDENVNNDEHIGLSPRTKKYRFDPQVLDWSNNILLNACPCDLLIVDELGPLELIQDQGWFGGLKVLQSGIYRLALVVVRPELVNTFIRHFPGQSIKLFILGVQNYQDPVVEILELLKI